MATPAEIVKRWDARIKREAAAARAKASFANDNRPKEPDGIIFVDGQPMAYWLPAGAPVDQPDEKKAIA